MNDLKRRIARQQRWWTRLFFASLIVAFLADLPVWIDLPVTALCLALSLVRAPRQDDHPPVEVASPVTGRWAALNSPADKVPSHGIRAYGQAFAIDIAHPRPKGAAASLGWGLRQRPPTAYSSFGQPVYAVRGGTVVTVTDGQRDHLARNTWPGIAYLMAVEGLARELAGAPRVIGNHVVIDHGDRVHSLYAHLRRGSATVRAGDRVEAGQLIGAVGNSGNTSEPHLHFQLMDDPAPAAAAGIPFRWNDIDQDPTDTDPTWASGQVREDITEGLPANGQVFTVPADRVLGQSPGHGSAP